MVGPSDFWPSVFCYLSCHQHLLLSESFTEPLAMNEGYLYNDAASWMMD
jgi:hypothetical protein